MKDYMETTTNSPTTLVKTIAVESLPRHLLESGIPTRDEINFTCKWLDIITGSDSVKPKLFEQWLGVSLPFSFKCDGKDSDSFLNQWEYERSKNGTEVSWTDPATGLKVIWQIKQCVGYPAVEYILTFKNTGDKDTPIIEDVKALRLDMRHSQQDKGFTVVWANGGRKERDDLMPFVWHNRTDYRMDTLELGGDLSSHKHLPFWCLATPEKRGVMVGFGWTGIWTAEMKVLGNEMTTTTKMRDLHTVLHPGEEVHSPRVLLVFWEGERLHGHNMLRRFLTEQRIHPVPSGRPRPFVTVNSSFTHHGSVVHLYLEDATEKTLLPLIQPFLYLGIEAFIIDAGWFECESWMDLEKSHNYSISRTRYPNGFRKISQPLKDAGVNFGLWFAPEWLGSLANPAIREEFLDIVDNLVEEELLTLFRQDAFTKWNNDNPNRVGIDEMRRMEGLYSVWDEVIRRHPNIVMEGCAGGGQRIDLEAIHRFSWFQRSDRWFDSESDQCALYGGNLFLPGGYLNIPTQALDNYGVWSSFAGQLCLAWHPIDPDFPMEQAKQQVDRYKRIRHLLSGDFYPMTECSLEEPWIAYQFDRQDIKEGIAFLYRRPNAQENSLTVAFRGVDPKTEYNVYFEGTKEDLVMTGQELASGLKVTLEISPEAEMIIYKAR